MQQNNSEQGGFWPPEQIENFSSLATLRILKDGEVLLWAGEESQHVYFVEEGHIKMCHYTERGDCIILLHHGPREVVGAGGVLNNTPRAVSGVAVEYCKIWEITADVFFRMMREYPDLAITIATSLAHRMRELDQQVLRVSSLPVEQRVALALWDFIGGEEGKNVSSLLRIRVTHQTLADVVGVCRQTITETLRRFRQEGILETQRGYIEILDIKKLKQRTGAECGAARRSFKTVSRFVMGKARQAALPFSFFSDILRI
ncbi:MAG: Crp/Fnr family transcriptional regulator [Oscillospiraceae bacterium]|nr:Crp/Fnr family transcriptional regulator [Oscillospiraceae bacterium]